MILAIETSAAVCAVGFYFENQQIAEYISDAPMKHSEQVGVFVEKGLKEIDREIQLVVVAIGPGSFTGLRIGLSYAQGFCFGKKIPVIGVSNHQVLASQGDKKNETYTVIDAHRQELYLAKHKSNDYVDIDTHKIIKATDIEKELPQGCQILFLDKTITKKQIEILSGKGITCKTGEYKTSLLSNLGSIMYSKGMARDPWDLEPMYIRPFAGVK
jgi:tRNA threonylcarbamoyladenosine biosynthesis protein TsaB